MLVGRAAELDRVDGLLAAARAARSGALVLRGDPGVGKTAVLDEARRRADGFLVLNARGVESESDLAFAGLHQLLRPGLHLIDGLPEPQAVALRRALGLDGGAAGERFAVSAAALTLLAELAETGPVLCLIDDAHWLDSPSLDVLAFVARRVQSECIALLFAVRERAYPSFLATDLSAVQLAPLGTDDAGALLDDRAGMTLALEVRDTLIRQAEGNPLALVELATALSADQLAGSAPLPATLPLTRSLEALFLERVRRLDPSCRTAALIVSADDSGVLRVVLAAAEALGVDPVAFDHLEAAAVVAVNGSRIAMHHPLARSAVYHGALSAERRAVHRALAAVLADPAETDRRAWHRAAAAVGPDEDVAAELEATAERARQRGGQAAAAATLERAADLSGDTAARCRRLVTGGGAAWHAGRADGAIRLLQAAVETGPDQAVQMEIALIRGQIQFQTGHLLGACDTLLAGAVPRPTGSPLRALRLLADAANAAENAGDRTRMATALRRAREVKPDDDDSRTVHDLLMGVGALLDGQGDDLDRVRAALAGTERMDEPIWLLWAAFGAGALGERAAEGQLLNRAVDRARRSGAVDLLTRSLLVVSVNGLFSGHFWVAADAAEGLTLAREAGLANTAAAFQAVLAWFAATQGRTDECRDRATEALAGASATGMALAGSIATWALALLDLGDGRPDDAADRLDAIRRGPPGVGHPYVSLMSTPDLVDAALRSGRHDLARWSLTPFEELAQQGRLDWARAVAARCRAQLGAGEGAESEFAVALRLHQGGDRLLDRSRTELAYGEFLRRQRRRRDARQQLRAAVDGFERLGAEPWAARARAELRASGETARRRQPGSITHLTPQELRIVGLVADGLSNKEVAARLFLSPRTIDYHLRNIFTKFGVGSRTQLIRLATDHLASLNGVTGDFTDSKG